MNKQKVFLLDDHPAIQDALYASLSKEEDIEIVGQATDSVNIETKLKSTKPDTLVADIQLKDAVLFSLIPKFREVLPDLSIVIFSMHYNKDFVMKALNNSVNGYVSKESPITLLIKGIKTVHAGGYFFDSNVVSIISQLIATLPSKISHKIDKNYEELTEREQLIFRYLAEGYNTKTIAALLSLSVGTIKNYQTNIYKKLNLKSPTELVHYASDIGLLIE